MSALSPQAYGFINRIRSLHNLDWDQVPFLDESQWRKFSGDPVKFLICANDETAAAICAAVETRQSMSAKPAQTCPQCGAETVDRPASGFIAKCGRHVLSPRENGCPANPAQVTDAMVDAACDAYHTAYADSTSRAGQQGMRAALTAVLSSQKPLGIATTPLSPNTVDDSRGPDPVAKQEPVVGDAESVRSFILKWIGAPRPPAHPNPMNGSQSFHAFDGAISFMRGQADDAQFVSMTELVTARIDRTDDARAILATAPKQGAK